MKTIEVKVPPIGDFKDVPVIDVLVKPGDAVAADAALVTLESEKATMDVPSPSAGRVRELRVKVGDRVSEGSVVVTLEEEGAAPAAGAPGPAPSRGNGHAAAPPPAQAAAPAPAPPAPAAPERTAAARPAARPPVEVKVPALGDFKDVPVIEVLVKPGDAVGHEAPLVTLESEKATMDVPSPVAGTIREVRVKVGDRVSEGSLVAIVDPAEAPGPADGAHGSGLAREIESATASAPRPGAIPVASPAVPAARPVAAAPAAPRPSAPPTEEERRALPHASPAIRQLARELGVDLGQVEGSGPKGRILKEDVQRRVKEVMARAASGAPAGGAALALAPWPKVDFAKYGPVERQPLSRIQRISSQALARNWVMIPHVTQHDEADVTELDAFRRSLSEEHAQEGVKVTLLAFVLKACVAALKAFPTVNASLEGEELVLKRYWNIGFAADTPFGLVVPVIRDADRKGVLELARETSALAAKAREGKLAPADMQGGTFSVSSLGGIGGTAFTPIINAPEVAILGVSRTATRPVWDGERFAPRLLLPLSLSYDHRVIDGALAARFTAHLARLLGDLRRAML